jgi:uncharacterized protein YhbP (UPF0306 family)
MNSEAKQVSLLHEYLREGKLMQIATTDGADSVWLAHCWYAVDDQLRLIFLSREDRVHSQHILRGSGVAGGIIAIDLEGLGQKIRGVTFAGKAELASDDVLDEAYETYSARWPQVQQMVTPNEIRARRTPNRIWRVRPTTYVLFDEVNFPDEPRQEIATW